MAIATPIRVVASDIGEVRAVIAAARLVLMSGANRREMERLQTALFILDNRDSAKAQALADGLFSDLGGSSEQDDSGIAPV